MINIFYLSIFILYMVLVYSIDYIVKGNGKTAEYIIDISYLLILLILLLIPFFIIYQKTM